MPRHKKRIATSVVTETRYNRHLVPIFSEHTTPGREAHLAKCPKCKKIILIERPLPHGPRSASFEVQAKRAIEKHSCEEG